MSQALSSYLIIKCFYLQQRGFLLSAKKADFANLRAHNGFAFLGHLKNGQVSGDFWAGMIGEAYLHGKADSNGFLTGNDISYIYPDGETAFRGHFENKFMRNAHHVDVKEYGCNDEGIVIMTLEKQFSNSYSNS